MINPAAYDAVLEAIDALITDSRRLGLFRTGEKLHRALEEGRSERFEAQPKDVVFLEIAVGPVREQRVSTP